MHPGESLTADERTRYGWQIAVDGFGERGQERLKGASVLVSRCGGVGGALAAQLAAAGVGRLILAHAGDLRLDDLNRQLLMTTEGIGSPRVEQAARSIRALNPLVRVETVAENICEANVAELVQRVDLVASCAPLFAERLLLNREAVRQKKPLIDSSMYEMQMQVTVVVPGVTPCLACLYPDEPPHWQRVFPVFGAVAGTAGCLGALEVIKHLTGLGETLRGKLLLGDLGVMRHQTITLLRRADCEVCGALEIANMPSLD